MNSSMQPMPAPEPGPRPVRAPEPRRNSPQGPSRHHDAPDQYTSTSTPDDPPPLLPPADRARALKAQLDWSRREALDALRRDARRSTEDWRPVLLPAARLVLDAADRLAAEAELFEDLVGAAEHFADNPALGDDAMLLLTQDLPVLLNHLGYRPPPPDEELADQLTGALAEVVRSRPDEVQVKATRERLWENLYFFRRRLSDLVVDAEHAHLPGHHAPPALRSQVRTVLDKGARILLPAALATGVTALFFPPAGAAAGIAVGLTAGGEALLKKAAETATAGLLDRALRGEAEAADPTERLTRATRAAARRVADLADLLEEPHGDLDRARAWWIDACSRVFAALRIAHAFGVNGSNFRESLHTALDALIDVDRLVMGPVPVDMVWALRRAAETMTNAAEDGPSLNW